MLSTWWTLSKWDLFRIAELVFLASLIFYNRPNEGYNKTITKVLVKLIEFLKCMYWMKVVSTWQESLMVDKIGDDVMCPDLPFAPITVGGRGGKGKQMQALLQLLQVQCFSDASHWSLYPPPSSSWSLSHLPSSSLPLLNPHLYSVFWDGTKFWAEHLANIESDFDGLNAFD